jgi:hypothetical protein
MRELSNNETYESVRFRMKTGDVIAFSGKGAFSNIIKWRFGTDCSHVAIVYSEEVGSFGKVVMIVESTTLTTLADAQTGDLVKGVQLHFLSKRLDSYDGDAWWVPLKEPLSEQGERKMCAWLRKTHDQRIPYDTAQAIGAGINFWDSILENDPDFSKLFCSELVARALQIAGVVDEDVNPSETAPSEVVAFDCLGEPVPLLSEETPDDDKG